VKKLLERLRVSWHSALGGALLCTVVGSTVLWFDGWPVYLSYDLLFFRDRAPRIDDVVVIYMDDRSFKELRQISTPNWDRALHADLLDRLTADQCRLVVLDVVLSEPGTPMANTNLARAIQQNGKVVLAAALKYPGRAQITTSESVLPLPEFEDVAAGVGFAEIEMRSSPGGVARRYYAGNEIRPGLPWVAAKVAGFPVGTLLKDQPLSWINYYGPALTIPRLSYSEVAVQSAGFFRNKSVFVGARPTLLKASDESDLFAIPHTLWTGEPAPGVEICATAFLNLVRNDGLVRHSGAQELLFVIIAGCVFGGLLGLLRPLIAAAASAFGMVILVAMALQVANQRVWVPWTVVAFAQIPAALAWSIRGHFHRLKFQKEVLERTLVETSRWAEAETAKAQQEGLVIPDHTLVRCVGKGAYGEVWLARNAIGAFHAVKIVKRGQFPNDTPYEREFKGIQKFMPISRSHPGFVHVLHVGRNDAAGFFFYIMEVCDDASSGQQIDPGSYSPKTLASELEWRGKLPPEECLRLGLSLTLALEHLHQQGLIHRDIKPGNIIYVNGAPKFADIGLVTDLAGTGRDVSCVGTEGYVPPEGPGTAGADVYALGKVLYEASMGRDRRMFPEVPTSVLEQPEDTFLRQLTEVIFKACETDAHARYPSARAMHADLLRVQNLPKRPVL
jgi:CHASE2 domain-containing sensor protein